MTERMTPERLRELQREHGMKKKKPRVRGAKSVVSSDGHRFQSRREARRWSYLKLLQSIGEIADLERQVPIALEGRDGAILTPTGRQMVYMADFTYRKNGELVVEDAKGHQTDTYKMKKAVLAAQGITIREV